MDRAIRFFPYILLIFHAVGIGLFLYLAKAPELSYLNILLSALLVLASEKINRSSIFVFAFIFVFGFIIELIGVQTGYLFGSYIYEEAMGPLVFGTPLIIGATWYAVVVGASAIASKIHKHKAIQAVIAGLLAVLMDVVIEQVAVGYGLWNWEGGEIPLYNYICWFIFGTAFSYLYIKLTRNHNDTARYLYWIWLAFFTILTVLV